MPFHIYGENTQVVDVNIWLGITINTITAI